MVPKYLLNNEWEMSGGIYSEKIQQAIDFAGKAHEGQKRKVSKLPYIIHPLCVALILARIKAKEKIIIAGLLHDTVEDCGVTIKEISKKFGKQAARIVDDLTEKDKKLPWQKRKQIAIAHIPKMNRDSLLVKSADVLHNLSGIKNGFKIYGDQIFKYFNATKNEQIERYRKLINALGKAWKKNPLLPELKKNFKLLKK